MGVAVVCGLVTALSIFRVVRPLSDLAARQRATLTGVTA